MKNERMDIKKSNNNHAAVLGAFCGKMYGTSEERLKFDISAKRLASKCRDVAWHLLICMSNVTNLRQLRDEVGANTSYESQIAYIIDLAGEKKPGVEALPYQSAVEANLADLRRTCNLVDRYTSDWIFLDGHLKVYRATIASIYKTMSNHSFRPYWRMANIYPLFIALEEAEEAIEESQHLCAYYW